MKAAIAIVFLICSGLGSLYGQLNPIYVYPTLRGEVILGVTPMDYLTHEPQLNPPIDSSRSMLRIEYKVLANGDTVQRSQQQFYYLNYPGFAPIIFTFQSPHSLANFPKTIERKMTQISKHTFKLTDFYWSGSPHGHETTWPHILDLKYDGHGRLIHLRENYYPLPKHPKKDNIRSTDWKYHWKGKQLTSIDIGKDKVDYRYDESGNLIAAISYSGSLEPISRYFCYDSLAAFYERKLGYFKASRLLDSYHTEVSQMAFFNYSAGKLIQMACYDASYGVQKSTIAYDSLDRVTSVMEDLISNGLRLEFTYEPNSNRLLQRSERIISGCFERGCREMELIETYHYNAAGLVSQIEYLHYDHDSKSGASIGYDTGRGVIFKYD